MKRNENNLIINYKMIIFFLLIIVPFTILSSKSKFNFERDLPRERLIISDSLYTSLCTAIVKIDRISNLLLEHFDSKEFFIEIIEITDSDESTEIGLGSIIRKRILSYMFRSLVEAISFLEALNDSLKYSQSNELLDLNDGHFECLEILNFNIENLSNKNIMASLQAQYSLIKQIEHLQKIWKEYYQAINNPSDIESEKFEKKER